MDDNVGWCQAVQTFQENTGKTLASESALFSGEPGSLQL